MYTCVMPMKGGSFREGFKRFYSRFVVLLLDRRGTVVRLLPSLLIGQGRLTSQTAMLSAQEQHGYAAGTIQPVRPRLSADVVPLIREVLQCVL